LLPLIFGLGIGYIHLDMVRIMLAKIVKDGIFTHVFLYGGANHLVGHE
jgi:hypothetical protein